MTGVIASLPKFQFSNALGLPMSGGTLTSYLAGTTTPATTYQDQALSTANTNPISLDSRGECTLWLDSTKTYKFVLKNAAGVTQWTVDNIINAQALVDQLRTDLAAPTGAGLVGYMPAGVGGVGTDVQSKLKETVSVVDKGAVIGDATDNSTAILNARNQVSGNGGMVIYGGKVNAAGFWENLSCLAQEWIRGSALAYAIDLVSSKPLISLKLFNGTPSAGPGYAAYGSRFDVYTKSGVDVASSVSGMFGMQSYSTNSSGANFNNTNQVALLANAAAMDTASSASVAAVNAIASSAYTGALPQVIIGVESDIGVTNAAGWFGDASKAYSVGFSAILQGSSANDGTVAYAVGTSSITKTWWHGVVVSGVSKTGLTVAREGTRVPETGVWVSAASTFGVYIGAKAKHQLNPGSIAEYAYKPAVGLCLGQEGATSSPSHKLRLTNTDGTSTEKNCDVIKGAAGNLEVHFDGTKRCEIQAANGGYNIGGLQVIGAREVGWGSNTGTTSKAAFDSATVTLQTLAQTVSALQQALKNHGLIGA